ncbi:MAG: sugar ABC transporter ATP-binding protein [Candidatus Excrementavichristensenella sp.]|jgi:ribose transport system ATP-binding protein
MGKMILQLKGIDKSFPGVHALREVDLNVYEGEVMALLGENGAGKSTLMKVLTGVLARDGGEILYQGKPVSYRNVRQAQDDGIAIIHQELNLIPKMRIYENIFLGRERKKKSGALDIRTMIETTRELLERVRVQLDPRERIENLSIAQQQMVEIAKALLLDARVIVMDEPTDALPDEEVDSLFGVIRQLKAQGKGLIYITHRLKEVFEICDRATILRDGSFIGELPVRELNMENLVSMMVGRELTEQFPYVKTARGREMLVVKGLSNAHVHDIDLTLYAGEVLGVAGLVGSGRTELAKTLYGLYPWEKGEVTLNGKPYRAEKPSEAIAQGLFYMTEDRKRNGLVMLMDVAGNITLSSLSRIRKGMSIDAKAEREIVSDYIEKINIRTPSMRQRARNLSGGNQQKVVLSKALMTEPNVLILDEPTRGIDVGAKKEIYHLINEMKERGVAILMISSEMPEILGMSDRILVLYDGRVRGELDREEATQEKIMSLILSDIQRKEAVSI